MNFQKEFVLLLKSQFPILYISTLEEERIEYTIRKIIKNTENSNIYVWDFVEGYQENLIYQKIGQRNPLQALEFIEKLNSKTSSLFILKDFKHFLTDIGISRKLKNIYKLLKIQPKTILLIDFEIKIPIDLRDLIVPLLFGLPQSLEIRQELEEILNTLQIKNKNYKYYLNQLTQACQGLSLERIRRVFIKIINLYQIIDKKSIKLILEEKKQIINQTEILEFWSTNNHLNELGGIFQLKEWILTREAGFSQKSFLYGLPIPKGLLLVGVQGTGKSLVVKGLANDWNLPLLRLDVGRLFGGIIGESELRVRKMIQLSETMSPCILWIDEIDKAFYESNQDSDSGTTNRVFGTFLTWLGEKTLPVFVVATANDLYKLPLEILRKGRFDEIFFIGLPSFEERKLIFRIHLRKLRPKTVSRYSIDLLSQKTNLFSGAEIEQSIIEAMYFAFREKREFTSSDILLAIKKIIPLAKVDPERTDLLQDWAYSGKIRTA